MTTSDDGAEHIGKYRIERTLGQGAMGVVYEAMDPALERRVALKTIRTDLLGRSEAEQIHERFSREARAAARLHHPNIVTVFDHGEADGVAYIAMEFVDGESLEDVLDREPRVTLEYAEHIMSGLLAGLGFAHENGVVHRDIKPSNIMITGGSAAAVKIADFGIAHLSGATMTEVGSVMGTPGYMAPEQCLGERADHRSDLFAAAVVLYRMLTGEQPFTGSVTAIIHKITSADPLPPSRLSTAVSPSLDAVIMRALSKRPADRYQDAAALLAAIQAALAPGADADDPTVMNPGGGWHADEPTVLAGADARGNATDAAGHEAPTLVPGTTTLPEVPPAAAAGKRGLWAALAVIVLGAGAVGGYYALRPEPAPPPPVEQPAPVATGTVDVQTTPPGVDVRGADGGFLGTAPVTLELPAGEHDISLSKPGYHDMQVSIEVQAGASTPLRAELQRR